MSKEQLMAFGKKVQSDEALHQEIAQLGQDSAGIVAAAKREGFDFSEEELNAYLQASSYDGSMELDEADLEQVVGGAVGSAACTFTCNPGNTSTLY